MRSFIHILLLLVCIVLHSAEESEKKEHSYKYELSHNILPFGESEKNVFTIPNLHIKNIWSVDKKYQLVVTYVNRGGGGSHLSIFDKNNNPYVITKPSEFRLFWDRNRKQHSTMGTTSDEGRIVLKQSKTSVVYVRVRQSLINGNHEWSLSLTDPGGSRIVFNKIKIPPPRRQHSKLWNELRIKRSKGEEEKTSDCNLTDSTASKVKTENAE